MSVRDIVFVHVPKTGGTSIRNSIREALAGSREEYFDYGKNDPLTSPIIKSLRDGKVDPDNFRKLIDHKVGVFLSGHFSAKKYAAIFHPQSFVCFVRHPFDRVYSTYIHHKNRKNLKMDFSQFIKIAKFKNIQYKLINGVDLDNYGFVGIFERLDRDFLRLKEFLGLDLDWRHSNAGKYDVSKEDMRQRWSDAVLNENQRDWDIYEKVLRRSEAEATGARKSQFAASKGAARLVKDTRIVGWASLDKGKFIATVELRDGTSCITRAEADIFRLGLKRQGIVEHGVAGFEFRVPGQADPGKLKLVIVQTGLEIAIVGKAETVES